MHPLGLTNSKIFWGVAPMAPLCPSLCGASHTYPDLPLHAKMAEESPHWSLLFAQLCLLLNTGKSFAEILFFKININNHNRSKYVCTIFKYLCMIKAIHTTRMAHKLKWGK